MTLHLGKRILEQISIPREPYPPGYAPTSVYPNSTSCPRIPAKEGELLEDLG
jgi:hypothetical protein